MKNEPFILAIETAVGTGGLSILKGNNEIASIIGDGKASRSEDLLKMISQMLEINRFKPNDIDLISVSVGPGSFTGVRVGLAVAKALAFGLNCQCVGVSVFEALALGAEAKGEVFVIVIPAGRSRIFWQLVLLNKLTGEMKKFPPQAGTFDNLLGALEIEGLRNFSIILESNVYKEIDIPISRLKNKTTGMRIIRASDNISKFIGQAGLFCTKNEFKARGDSLSEVIPQYVFGVDGKTQK